MSHCSGSSTSSCTASSAACSAAAAGDASSSASGFTTMMGGAAVAGASANRSRLFSLTNMQATAESEIDCWGQFIVWVIFIMGLVLLMVDFVDSSRVNSPVSPPSEFSQINHP